MTHADEAWPTLDTPVEADATAQRLARAAAIPGLTAADGTPRGWTDEHHLLLVDLHLEGAFEQHLTGLATLLDWHREAEALDAAHGPVLGRLADARDHMLGALERAWGRDGTATRAHLLALRADAPHNPPPERPPLPQPPSSSIEGPPSPGVHTVGELVVGDEVSVLHGGFPGPGWGPGVDVVIGTRPGRWTVRLVVESSGSRLSRATFGEEMDDPFLWLLLTHASVPGLPDTPDAVIPEGDDWGKLTVVAGQPTRHQISSICHSPHHYVDLWQWGVGWMRPRCPAPMALGGPEGARTWIALVDTISY